MKLNEITSQLHKIKSLPNFPHKKNFEAKAVGLHAKKDRHLSDYGRTHIEQNLNFVTFSFHRLVTLPTWIRFRQSRRLLQPISPEWASAPRLRFYRARSSKCVERARGQISSLLVARRETGARVVPTLVDRGGSDVVVSWWPLSGNMQKPSRQLAANDKTP